MAPDLIRDSTFGALVNYLSHGRLLPYADQRPDYVVPSRYLKQGGASSPSSSLSRTSTLAGDAVGHTLVADDLAKQCTATCRQLNKTQDSTRERAARPASPDSPTDGVTLVDGVGVCKELKPVGESAGDLEKQEGKPSLQNTSDYPFLVTFDSPDDPDRPQCVLAPRKVPL